MVCSLIDYNVFFVISHQELQRWRKQDAVLMVLYEQEKLLVYAHAKLSNLMFCKTHLSNYFARFILIGLDRLS